MVLISCITHKAISGSPVADTAAEVAAAAAEEVAVAAAAAAEVAVAAAR